MTNNNDPTDAASRRFGFLVRVLTWSRQVLKWIMSPSEGNTILPMWERSCAAGSGLMLLAGMTVGPGWYISPNAMFAFADVVTKFPMMIGFPIITAFALVTGVIAALQPRGAFSEHFLRGFLLLPFMIIPLYVLITILFLVLGMLRIVMIPLSIL